MPEENKTQQTGSGVTDTNELQSTLAGSGITDTNEFTQSTCTHGQETAQDLKATAGGVVETRLSKSGTMQKNAYEPSKKMPTNMCETIPLKRY